MSEKERIIQYIVDNFNVDSMSYRLIEELYGYINLKWCGRTSIYINGRNYTINAYIQEFIEKMNYCNIDITINELIENSVIDIF